MAVIAVLMASCPFQNTVCVAYCKHCLCSCSDYTEGVPGIGIVNALEIVRAFPTDDDLKGFRDWVNNPDAEALALAQGKGKQPGELRRRCCLVILQNLLKQVQ